MGEVKQYFFDTYALYEMVLGNPAYVSLTHDVGFVCTRMNLLELHYALLRTYGPKTADHLYDAFAPFVLDPDDTVMKSASVMKAAHKKKRLSYVDCIGYVIAIRLGIPFLTGDKEFKGMAGVTWVQ